MRLTIKIETKAKNAFFSDQDVATKHYMPLHDKLSSTYVLQQIEQLVMRLSQDAREQEDALIFSRGAQDASVLAGMGRK